MRLKNRVIKGRTALLEVGICNRGHALDVLFEAEGESRQWTLTGDLGAGVIMTWPLEAPAFGPWTVTLALHHQALDPLTTKLNALVYTREVPRRRPIIGRRWLVE